MKSLFLVIIAYFLFACETIEVAEKPIEATQLAKSMTGEWYYVGTFSHLADYKCLICEGFDESKAIYKMTFKEDGTFSGRVNLLITQGKYSLKDTKEDLQKNISGTITVSELNFLNKPPQTQADTDFIDTFENASSIYMDVNSSKSYNLLQFTSKNKPNTYIVMAKKK